jgi:hypothetical protein
VRVGVALTLALTVLSFVRISPSGIGYRSAEIWSNQATLVLTQEGAPELRSVLPLGPGGSTTALADTGRFASLIDVYASLATSDAVLGELRRRGLVKATDLENGALPIAAGPVQSTVNASTPMMTLSAKAASAEKSTKLTLAATQTFLDVVHARQRAAKIPVKDRIQVRVVKSSEAPKLISPRSKALTMIVLLGGLIATAAVAFTRDNLARREGALELAIADSPDEPAEADSSVGATHARGTVARGRSTLGPVPSPDSAIAPERDVPDEGARRWG